MGYNRSENDVTKLPFFSIIFAIAEIFCGKFSPTDRLQTFSSMCQYTRVSSSHTSHLFIPTTSFTPHTFSPLPSLSFSPPVCLVITCVATGEKRWCVCAATPTITKYNRWLSGADTHPDWQANKLAHHSSFLLVPIPWDFSLWFTPYISSTRMTQVVYLYCKKERASSREKEVDRQTREK